jgi:transposase
LIFGGFALGFKSKLIILTQGTVDWNIYIDDCIDDSAIIPEMNHMHGPGNWTLMQDGASAHTKASPIEYLKLYCNILENWPSGSPGLNPIENLWAIIKHRIAELGVRTLVDLIQITKDVWEAVTQQELANLVSSMRSRLEATVLAQGGPNGY